MFSIDLQLEVEVIEKKSSKAISRVQELLDTLSEASKSDEVPFFFDGSADECEVNGDLATVICGAWLDIESNSEQEALRIADTVLANLRALTLEGQGFQVEGTINSAVYETEDEEEL